MYQSDVDSWNSSTYNNVSVWCRQLELFNLQQCISLVLTAGTLQPTKMYQSGVDSWNSSTCDLVFTKPFNLHQCIISPLLTAETLLTIPEYHKSGVDQTLQPTLVYQYGVDSWNPSTYNSATLSLVLTKPFNLQQCTNSLVLTVGTLQPTTVYQYGVDSWNPSTYNSATLSLVLTKPFNLQQCTNSLVLTVGILQPTTVYQYGVDSWNPSTYNRVSIVWC